MLATLKRMIVSVPHFCHGESSPELAANAAVLAATSFMRVCCCS